MEEEQEQMQEKRVYWMDSQVRVRKWRRETDERQAKDTEGTDYTETDMPVGEDTGQTQGARCKTVQIQNAVSDVSDLGQKCDGPNQIKLLEYPQQRFGLRKRSFSAIWFSNFPWLEYSVSKDATFCFSCRMFGKNIRHDNFVSTGVSNWKKALDIFREHEKSPAHTSSMIGWHSFKACTSHGNVAEQLHSAHEAEIIERREYFTRIVAVTKFLLKQGIPFRGHNEGISSNNQGNFLECVSLVKEFDSFLQSYSAPSHSTYLSTSSQNEIIECCAEEVSVSIASKIKHAGMFAIMADEARDGNREQLAICVRFVNESGIKECLLVLTELREFDAENITSAIENQLSLSGINNVMCVAQLYDGAFVMSGAVGRVQARFRVNHPEAIYVHCYTHQLNLVLCHTCHAIPEANQLFDMLQCVHNFQHISSKPS